MAMEKPDAELAEIRLEQFLDLSHSYGSREFASLAQEHFRSACSRFFCNFDYFECEIFSIHRYITGEEHVGRTGPVRPRAGRKSGDPERVQH